MRRKKENTLGETKRRQERNKKLRDMSQRVQNKMVEMNLLISIQMITVNGLN